MGMENQIFLIKNVKDKSKFKKSFFEKVRTVVSPEASLDENMINVSRKTTWARSKATITFADKGQDVEVMIATSHSATGTAIGVGCILCLFTLILVIVPWLLYDQDKKEFDKGLINVVNYFVSQTPG
jgi:hypothetical protein